MTLQLLFLTYLYVVNDPYFLVSMTLTSLIGIFIGAVTYDGNIGEMKKGIILLVSYLFMLISVTTTRVIPAIGSTTHPERPFAGIVTILIVTFFYVIGMIIGVRVTRKAHRV